MTIFSLKEHSKIHQFTLRCHKQSPRRKNCQQTTFWKFTTQGHSHAFTTRALQRKNGMQITFQGLNISRLTVTISALKKDQSTQTPLVIPTSEARKRNEEEKPIELTYQAPIIETHEGCKGAELIGLTYQTPICKAHFGCKRGKLTKPFFQIPKSEAHKGYSTDKSPCHPVDCQNSKHMKATFKMTSPKHPDRHKKVRPWKLQAV